MDCARDQRCRYTCDNRNNSIRCRFPCIVKGCQCPEGQVVNELTNECVEPAMCPASKFTLSLVHNCMFSAAYWLDTEWLYPKSKFALL